MYTGCKYANIMFAFYSSSFPVGFKKRLDISDGRLRNRTPLGVRLHNQSRLSRRVI